MSALATKLPSNIDTSDALFARLRMAALYKNYHPEEKDDALDDIWTRATKGLAIKKGMNDAQFSCLTAVRRYLDNSPDEMSDDIESLEEARQHAKKSIEKVLETLELAGKQPFHEKYLAQLFPQKTVLPLAKPEQLLWQSESDTRTTKKDAAGSSTEWQITVATASPYSRDELYAPLHSTDDEAIAGIIAALAADESDQAVTHLHEVAGDKSNDEMLNWLVRNKRWTDFLENRLVEDGAIETYKDLVRARAIINKIDTQPFGTLEETVATYGPAAKVAYVLMKIRLEEALAHEVKRASCMAIFREAFASLTKQHFPHLQAEVNIEQSAQQSFIEEPKADIEAEHLPIREKQAEQDDETWIKVAYGRTRSSRQRGATKTSSGPTSTRIDPFAPVTIKTKPEVFFNNPIDGNPVTRALNAAAGETLTLKDFEPYSNLALLEKMSQCLEGMVSEIEQKRNKIAPSAYKAITTIRERLEEQLKQLDPNNSQSVKGLRNEIIRFFDEEFSRAVNTSMKQVFMGPNKPSAKGHPHSSSVVNNIGALLTSRLYDDFAVTGARDKASQKTLRKFPQERDILAPLHDETLMEQRTVAVFGGAQSMARTFLINIEHQAAENTSRTIAFVEARTYWPSGEKQGKQQEGFEILLHSISGGPEAQEPLIRYAKSSKPFYTLETRVAPLPEGEFVCNMLEETEPGKIVTRILDAEHMGLDFLERQTDQAVKKRGLKPDDVKGAWLLTASVPFCGECAKKIYAISEKYKNLKIIPLTRKKTLHLSEIKKLGGDVAHEGKSRVAHSLDGVTAQMDMPSYAELIRRRQAIEALAKETGLAPNKIIVMRVDQFKSDERFKSKTFQGVVVRPHKDRPDALYGRMEGPRLQGTTIFVKGLKEELTIETADKVERVRISGIDVEQKSKASEQKIEKKRR